MPTYRLTRPDGSSEVLEASSAEVEGAHTVLRASGWVMGRSRRIVVRRAPLDVRVEEIAAWAPQPRSPQEAVPARR